MTAGLFMDLRVWRMSQAADDSVGGAVITGSVAYACIKGRINHRPPTLMLLEQGLESDRLATALVRPSSLIIYERDEIEVIGPALSLDIGRRFRVISVTKDQVHPTDSRGTLSLTLRRIERTRRQQ